MKLDGFSVHLGMAIGMIIGLLIAYGLIFMELKRLVTGVP